MLLRQFRRVGVALGAAAIVSLATQGVATAQPDVVQRFSATSGDACGYGYTNGHLTWPAAAPGVGVKGSVVDNPVDWTFNCRDDGRITVAHFIAYTANGAAQRHAERADNSGQDFSFRLGVNSATTRIEYVTVQVCRYSTNIVADYCGLTQTYRNPL